MSRLTEHAKRELELAHLDESDADYGPGVIMRAVMDLVTVFDGQRNHHSGESGEMVLQLFEKVARQQALTPLTDALDEWENRTHLGSVGARPLWQNKRDSRAFSNDGGKTWWWVT